MHQAIERIGFGTLVTAGTAGPLLTHLPMMVVADGTRGRILGHVSRANPQWHDAGVGHAVASFVGASFYVSPNYYASKAITGKVVPTWNYIAVEARGSIEFYDDRDRLLALVERLTNHYEASQPRPWTVSDAPPSYIEAQLRGIVGFALAIDDLVGAWKLSRNKTDADRGGIADAISASDVRAVRELAHKVRQGAATAND